MDRGRLPAGEVMDQQNENNNLGQNVVALPSLCGSIEAYAHSVGCMEEPEALFPAITMQELMGGDYSITYLCNGVLAEGQPAIMGGPQKAFKTSLALELAVCLATGRTFLQQFEVSEPVKVCYFAGEGGLEVMQDTFRRIGTAKDIAIGCIENLLVTNTVPRLDNIEHLDALREYVEEHTPKVVFFDPLYLAMSGADTGNVFSMGERLKALLDVCQPIGCTPVLLHHFRKGRLDKHKPAGLEDLSMSDFAEFAGQWVLLSRRNEYDPDDPTHRLWVSFGGRTGHGSQWGLNINEIDRLTYQRTWRTELKRQDEVRAEHEGQKVRKQAEREREKKAELRNAAEQVLEWILSKPEGVTKQNVKDSGHCPAAKAGEILTRLEEEGRIEVCQVAVPTGTGTRQVAGYRVVTACCEEPVA